MNDKIYTIFYSIACFTLGITALINDISVLGLFLITFGLIVSYANIKKIYSEQTSKESHNDEKSNTEGNNNMSPDEIKAYKILGVSKEDSDDTIKKRYLKLKRLYSDDKNNFKNNSKKQYGRDKKDIDYKALWELEWAWNIIKATRQFNQPNEKNSRAKEADYKYCLLLLCAEVMKGDGKRMVCELDKVKETIRRYYKTEVQQIEALKEFKKILDSDQDLKKVYQTVNRCLNPAAKSDILMELLAIAYSDDNFSTVEENIIKEIARNLNINDETYKSIYTIFVKKYEGKFYEANQKNEESNKKKNKKQNSKKRHDSDESKSSSNSNSSNSQSKNRSRISVSEAYDILCVSGEMSDAEIKKAYRALAIQYHPDNAASLGDEAIRQATETMQQINVAWDVVKMARGIK